MTSAASILRDTRGAVAAEMALILPMLLALTFMMLEGAAFAWNEHKVIMGVRDAARYAGRLDFSNFVTQSGGTYTCPATVPAGVVTQIKNIARTGQISGGNARISGWVDSDVTVTVSCTAATGGLYAVVGGNAPKVKVSANVLYPSLVGSTLGFSTSMRIGGAAESPVMGL
ncbi:TadE/TadG family type IV pilus assembly protein [Novosphingobium aquiterrae]|uniref:TadE/TadG family type IV pilus assembly protein n=1 Tax=Novosphingobium aquiterrae TaxID=624388 RepID=A0ABV6PKL0_9SPHN